MNITCAALGCFLLAAQAEAAEQHIILTWLPGVDMAKRKQQFDGYPPSASLIIGRIKNDSQITGIKCRVEKPVGGTAVIGVWAAAPKMPLDYGFKVSATDCDANAAADADQSLGVTTDRYPAGWNIGVIATGAGWEDSEGSGALAITYESEHQ